MAKKEKVKKPFYKKWWVWLIAIVVIGSFATSGDEETATPETDTATEETAATPAKEEKKAEAPKKEEKKAFAVGDEVVVENFTYKVIGIEETNKLTSVLGDKTTEGKYAVVELAVTNKDKKARYVDGNMFRILTADGTEYSSDAELGTYVNENGLGFFLEDINPNISKTGKIAFELPKEATAYDLQVSSGLGWSGGKYETIKLK
ncbi:MAG: DUF4352 domain-containing protein [Bacillota bacterium]